MVKFLSGKQYDGTNVPLCAFWRADVRTDPSKELAPLEGTGLPDPQQGKGQNSAIGDFSGQCIANAFFEKSSISCFNNGRCNEEGKCLPCTRYRYGGMKMAITHSPPLDILRFFDKGLTEEDIQSPNLTRFPPEVARRSDVDQIPYHILVRNIQAEIAKCCHWSAGDGSPDQFFIAQIIDGPDTIEVATERGGTITLKGLRIKNDEFPDEVGTFFPVGGTVVAGFRSQPSFYLEPRTGLVKDGLNVIYTLTSGATAGDAEDTTLENETTSTARAKLTAANTVPAVPSAVNAAIFACNTATTQAATLNSFLISASQTGDSNTIAAARAKFEAANANRSNACEAAGAAEVLGQEATDLLAAIISATSKDTVLTAANAAADILDELAVEVDKAGAAVGSTAAATQVQRQSRQLRVGARLLRFAGKGGITKCEFFFTDENVAKQWNNPEDGSLPCNGVRTDCDFYTGAAWKFATDEKMEIGRPILAEQIQEVRFRSEDWSRFVDPDQEFENRFKTPFIWAFKGYTEVSSQPELENMLLYRPKVLFARDTGRDAWETIEMNRVSIQNLKAAQDSFAVRKSTARIQPGSRDVAATQPPQFPSLIAQPLVPTATRVKITFPRFEDLPFVYRMWSPDKNKITLFGTASPFQNIFIINRTALRERLRYHLKFGSKNFFDIPTDITGAPDFTKFTATDLDAMVKPLRNEKIANPDPEAPLGFDETTSDGTGFWQSIQEVDLVHNQVNVIYVFLVATETSVLSDFTLIDCRFLHAIPTQTEFTATDFSVNDAVDESRLGNNNLDTTPSAKLVATTQQMVGSRIEKLSLQQGYYGLRFKDRNLKFGILNADNDLLGQNPVADQAPTFLVTQAGPSEFIANVSYNVVQYQKEDVVIDPAERTQVDIDSEGNVIGTSQVSGPGEWFLIHDCGFIMVKLFDIEVHRVLPLASQQGDFKPIPDILVNGGGRGSEIAQWGVLKATLRVGTEDRELVQFYRDPDGFGLPANYVLLGPRSDSSAQNAFGRPDPEKDTLTLSYTFLRAQSTQQDPTGDIGFGDNAAEEPELIGGGTLDSLSVVTENFYSDSLRTRKHAVTFTLGAIGEAKLEAGGEDFNSRISNEGQEYVFVFADEDGRPIGKKYTRMYLMYYNLSCINVEIFYRWTSRCTMYALLPDLNVRIGDTEGNLTGTPSATSDPNDPNFQTAFRAGQLVGERDCVQVPLCATHFFVAFGPLRREFEVIVNKTEGEGEDAVTFQKANFPSAGGPIEGPIVSSEQPGSQFLKKQGPMWYPYTSCERPRYQFNTYGPLRTDSTELINTTISPPGLVTGATVVVDQGTGIVPGSPGSFGGLPDRACEAYHGPDQMVPRILDIHPRLRACTIAYTYGNLVRKEGENQFTGYARRRGVLDQGRYEFFTWEKPKFGNFGRSRLVFEATDVRGDYIGGLNSTSVNFRWMPMFPSRPNIGATLELFGEDLEPQSYRVLCQSTPVATLNETVSESSSQGGLTVLGTKRFTQKQLIVNKTAGAIEFPFSPFFPMFVPDDDIASGDEVNAPAFDEASGIRPISTMWAWREAEKSIQRGIGNTGQILKGIRLASPDYFIDNRRLEKRLRPTEATYLLTWTNPTYNTDGTVKKNASIKLGSDGPPREILIDFKNRKFETVDVENSIYNPNTTLQDLGCEPDTASDNPNMAPLCSCISDITDSSLKASSNDGITKLPSRFLHLDELAPDGFVGLYQDSRLRTPFLVDINRSTLDDPCCLCVYTIPGIFFHLNGDFIPSITDLDPAADSRLEAKYTWSRVPHGLGGANRIAADDNFGGIENLADVLLPFDKGAVFNTFNRIPSNRRSLFLGDGAVFPSQVLAAERFSEDEDGNSDPIFVAGLDPDNPTEARKLKGGLPTREGNLGTRFSQGETENIVLTMLFDTYVRITRVVVVFYAGVGFQAPKYQVAVVPIENRVNVNELVTTNLGRIVGEALTEAIEGNIPNRDDFRDADVAEGLAAFRSVVRPVYGDIPFWESYGMEWQLIFPVRGVAQSMGIASIEITCDALTDGSANAELIGVRERKYYRSTGSISDDLNPERFLQEVDSATVYWRSTDGSSFKGYNRHRAYAWGPEHIDDGTREAGNDIQALELLQAAEYDNARSLLASPYQFNYTSFIPLDERTWLELLAEGQPSWSLALSMKINPVQVVRTQSEQGGNLLYGEVPKRTNFNAPGHAWVHDFDTTWASCSFDSIGSESMIIDYQFIHLHDRLAIVETAGFWEELPSGFTRLIRSTLGRPDANFQPDRVDDPQGIVLIDATAFTDSSGNAIPTSVLEASGFTKDPATGDIYIDTSYPGTGVGGATGPGDDCLPVPTEDEEG